MNSIYIKTFSILFTGIFIAACGANKQQAMLDTINSPQARPATFEALNEDFSIAERDQVNLISPDKFLQAQKFFKEAEVLRAKGQSADNINDKLEDARSLLDNAMTFSKQNKDRMDPLIDARQIALNSGAAETTNKDLKALEENYLRLVADLEKKNYRSSALERIPELTEDYKKLTIKTFQAKHLGEARNNVQLAKKEGAEKLVPKTLKETEETVKAASDYIAQNPNPDSMAKINQLGTEASVASRRLLSLTRQTKSSKDLSAEDRSLKTEALANSAGEESNRLKNTLVGSQEKITELEAKTKDYAKLEQRDEKNKSFETVRGLFNDEEAKVSRQGDTLVISLKKINFAVNKSDIPSQSFPLLRKVQTAIQGFKQPSIVVEGHTDSTGDAALNKTLSELRAEAVKGYFLSNSVMPAERVVAIGYGSEKPLASNKSSEGRSMNRRIDIVIKD